MTKLSIDPHPLTVFDPRTSLGATIDFHDEGQTRQIMTKANVAAMLSAGFQPLSYRLGTELAGEAWHWNPKGTWSDPEHEQGYWSSLASSDKPIEVSYGYRLPRRGNTLDQARNDSYSRIDDGDLTTFWKSNPYTGQDQWFLVDLGAPKPVQTIHIDWGDPYPELYRVEWWNGEDPINAPQEGTWKAFPRGEVQHNRGGHTDQVLCDVPITVRYVRVLMTQSSGRYWRSSPDLRDSTGFAVAEVSIDDWVRHGTSNKTQSVIWVSSTDPWHRASDIDRSVEQPGLDLVFRSGLTRGLDMLTPVAVLYGVPEDAVAEIRYLRSRGYPVSLIEMGEEPDGQEMSPEDYAELYVQFANALNQVDASLQFGGPAFQGTNDVIAFWPDSDHATSWIGRFMAQLKLAGNLSDFSFFTFEWYPFDRICDDPHEQLVKAPKILDEVLANWRAEGLPPKMPMLATEYGWSSYAGAPEVGMESALFNAEFVADFLGHGGTAAYFYGLEPEVLIREAACPSWGNLMLFLSDAARHIRYKLATYWSARMVTQECTTGRGRHELHAVNGTTDLLRAWAVKRPDGAWSMLLINKEKSKPVRVRPFPGPMEVVQYSPREYEWRANGEQGAPARSLPPRRWKTSGEVELPAYSITVVTAR